MNTTIPATSVTLDDQHRHHGGSWHGLTDQQAIAALEREANAKFLGLHNSASVNATASALAASHADEEMQEGFCEVKTHAVGATVRASERSDDKFFSGQKQVSDAATSVVVGFKDAQAQAFQTEGRSLLEAAKNAAALSVQADKNSAAMQLQAQTFASAAALQAQTIASAATLQAQQIAATAAAQAAECCCELKMLVTAQGEQTRNLMNSNRIEELRDKLQATQRLIPVTIPVGA